MAYRFRYPFVIFFLALILHTQSQTLISVTGKVTEAATGNPVPFANVVFRGTTDGAITDFDGNYSAQTNLPVDSIEARYIGFITRSKLVSSDANQVINFQLDEDVQTLGEVIVYAGENPAFPILREVIKHKKFNDKRFMEAYEYEAYTKLELDLDNISESFKGRKFVSKITAVMDSISLIAGEDGMPILPFFISEAVSRMYYKSSPDLRKENIIKTKITGVGITDGTLTSQVIGSTLQEYNFYRNWLNIASKEFVSPIADGWRIYYKYDLIDSLYIGDDYCYRLDFYPRNEQDLAFSGTMWITQQDYALKRIDATIPKEVNLNYIEKIKVQQNLIKVENGFWMPEQSRVLVDVAQLTDKTAGFLAKFYSSAKDFVVDQPMPDDFYLNPVTMEDNVGDYEEDYWERVRHDSLSATELNVYQMIDTLRRIPVVKNTMNLAKFIVNGYHPVGKIDLGPYTVFFGNNNIEGVRFGFGGRTNYSFNRKIVLGGYLGYGLKDERFKYLGRVTFIPDRLKWTTIQLEHQHELEQIWLLAQNVEHNSFFYTFSRFGEMMQPFIYSKNRITASRQISRGVNQIIEFKQQSFEPQFDFSFSPVNDFSTRTISNFDISEVTLITRFAKDESFVVDDNQRVSLGIRRWPALTMSYTYGIPNLLGSDMEYHRLKFDIEKKQNFGFLGISTLEVSGGYIIGNVPYPLAFNFIGNETPIYAGFTYNLMNFFEFSSDKYISAKYKHSFQGLILNKIPLMKKLKWRLFTITRIAYGGMKESNIQLVNYPLDNNGDSIIPFYSFENKPYVEFGYGIENIFKIFRVDAYHRLTYLNHKNVNKFGVKFSIQFIL